MRVSFVTHSRTILHRSTLERGESQQCNMLTVSTGQRLVACPLMGLLRHIYFLFIFVTTFCMATETLQCYATFGLFVCFFHKHFLFHLRLLEKVLLQNKPQNLLANIFFDILSLVWLLANCLISRMVTVPDYQLRCRGFYSRYFRLGDCPKLMRSGRECTQPRKDN